MSKRYRRGFSGLIILVVGSHLLSLGLLGSSLFLSRAWDVKRLESVLPLLEQLELSDYRNQGWCKNIFYKEGAFSNNNEQSTCNLFAETARPFTPDAEHTFRRLARTLRARQLNVRWISRFSDEQKALTTEFHLGCFFCSRPRYVYEPGYEIPLDEPDEMWYTPIDENWYVVEEDW